MFSSLSAVSSLVTRLGLASLIQVPPTSSRRTALWVGALFSSAVVSRAAASFVFFRMLSPVLRRFIKVITLLFSSNVIPVSRHSGGKLCPASGWSGIAQALFIYGLSEPTSRFLSLLLVHQRHSAPEPTSDASESHFLPVWSSDIEQISSPSNLAVTGQEPHLYVTVAAGFDTSPKCSNIVVSPQASTGFGQVFCCCCTNDSLCSLQPTVTTFKERPRNRPSVL